MHVRESVAQIVGGGMLRYAVKATERLKLLWECKYAPPVCYFLSPGENNLPKQLRKV